MARRTRAELEAQNLMLYRELETIRDRLDELLEDDEVLDDTEPAEDEADDSDRDDAETSNRDPGMAGSRPSVVLPVSCFGRRSGCGEAR